MQFCNCKIRPARKLRKANYGDKYGVLEEEVVAALQQEGMQDRLDDVRAYYDGYDTAIGVHLYNPWAMINYLRHKKLASYWTETGRYDFLAEAMWAGPMEMREKLLLLLAEITNELRTIWDRIFASENVSQNCASLVKAILTGDEVEFVFNVEPIARLFR